MQETCILCDEFVNGVSTLLDSTTQGLCMSYRTWRSNS